MQMNIETNGNSTLTENNSLNGTEPRPNDGLFSSLPVKLSYKGEMRRFEFHFARNGEGENSNFQSLVRDLRNLFNLKDESLTVQYQDDEEDWINITSDVELAHSIQLMNGKLLRLRALTGGEQAVPQQLPPPYPENGLLMSNPVQQSMERMKISEGKGFSGKSNEHLYPVYDKSMKMRFIRDVTISPGTKVAPGERFTKTWCLRNESPRWDFVNPQYNVWAILAFKRGDQLCPYTTIPLVSLMPDFNEEFTISLDLTAPHLPGHYGGVWKFVHPITGKPFGKLLRYEIVVEIPSEKDQNSEAWMSKKLEKVSKKHQKLSEREDKLGKKFDKKIAKVNEKQNNLLHKESFKINEKPHKKDKIEKVIVKQYAKLEKKQEKLNHKLGKKIGKVDKHINKLEKKSSKYMQATSGVITVDKPMYSEASNAMQDEDEDEDEDEEESLDIQNSVTSPVTPATMAVIPPTQLYPKI